MGREFNYDTTGSTSMFFVITVLAIYLVAATINRVRRFSNTKKDEKDKDVHCLCDGCVRKINSKKVKSFSGRVISRLPSVFDMIYFLALIALFFLLRQTSSVEIEAIYDPYTILGKASYLFLLQTSSMVRIRRTSSANIAS